MADQKKKPTGGEEKEKPKETKETALDTLYNQLMGYEDKKKDK